MLIEKKKKKWHMCAGFLLDQLLASVKYIPHSVLSVH